MTIKRSDNGTAGLAGEALRDRVADLIRQEQETGEPGWFYLSFVDGKFLGAAIVHALGPTDAVKQTHRLGINPGGEVAIMRCPDGVELPEEAKHRLLSFADMERLGWEPVREADLP